jgi:cytochrome c553
MKAVGSTRLALHTAILAIVFSAAGHAQDKDKATFSRPDLQAKIVYCKTCHGLSGQGYRGYFPMPRLAGQTTEYFEDQLRAFAQRSRNEDLLLNMSKVHSLSAEMRTALSAHFRELNPGPLRGGKNNLVATGKKSYEEGIPEANVPACVSCHGPEAKGDRAFPRLAGQLHDYIVKTLMNWNKERGQRSGDTSAIMTPIARNLNESQIEALAAYLNYLD